MKYVTTAARLRAALDEKGLRSQDLANKTGIGKSSISQWINGRNKPSYQSAVKMARVLACDPYWLMGLDNNPVDIIVDMFSETDERLSYIVEVFDNSTEKQKAWLYYCAKMLEEDK